MRSVNEVVFGRMNKDRYIDYSWMFAAYVNENHVAIDEVLRRILNVPVPIVREFVGYAKGEQEVINQVFAIWYFFQRSGFTYSSIATPTGHTEGVFTQYVRTVSDSLRTSQANCIDGTVLFASILRRIGIDPLIVLVPSHAFLGFYLDKNHKQAAYLETTAMNSAMNPYRQQRPSKFLDGMARFFQMDSKIAPAAHSFNYALDVARETYGKARPGFVGKQPQYHVIDIARMRQMGVNPINR